ncbi:MAG: class I SAM-dependent methyltransferase [Streptosporangiaceae bacterium]
MAAARYDRVADSYAAENDSADDPVSQAVLAMVGPVAGQRVLDIACGHGRLTRELAGRGARVTGLDVSAALVARALAVERQVSLGITYVVADVGRWQPPEPATFDAVTCNFGLSDIDDLPGCAACVAAALRPGGVFAFGILHPCFAGGADVSGSWPADRIYYDEGRWTARGALSTLRRVVGANHRTLSTYVNTLRAHGLILDRVAEPRPAGGWAASRPDAASSPVFLVARCVRWAAAVPGPRGE